MRFAEALAARKDAQKQIVQLKQRLTQNAMTQEGDQTPEDPADLLREYERTMDE